MRSSARDNVAIVVFATVLGVSITYAHRASAQSPASEVVRPRIQLTFLGEWDSSLQTEVMNSLSVRLLERGYTIEDQSARPVAIARVTSPNEGKVHIVAVHPSTGGEVTKEVELDGIPDDVWAPFLATAADEVLRVCLEEAALAERSRQNPTRVFVLSAGLEVVGYGGEALLIGVGAGGAIYIDDDIAFHLSVYASGLPPADSTLGHIDGMLAGGGFSVRVPLVAGDWSLELLGTGRAGAMWWRGHGNEESVGGDAVEAVVSVLAGLGARIPVSPPWHIDLAFQLGFTPVSTTAYDALGPVIGMTGLVALGQVGIAVWP